MSILTDLEAALEANGGVEYAGDCDRCMGDPYGDDCDTRHAEQIRHYAYTSLLTDDTIRALLDVAEAMRDTCIMGAAEREDGLIIPPRQVQSIASKLATLVKEADHE